MNFSHGHNRKGNTSPEYRAWCHMKSRCSNPNDSRYYTHGARGIRVCERWMKFDNFLADMGLRPKGLTLERMDNDGNYEPSNCKWADRSAQMLNRRQWRRHGTTGYTRAATKAERWVAQTSFKGQYAYLGIFATKEEAHAAYEKAKNAQG